MAECAKESEADRGQVAAPASPANQSCRCRALRSARARDRATTVAAILRAPVHERARDHPRAFHDRDSPEAPKHTRLPVPLAAVSQTRRDVPAKLSWGSASRHVGVRLDHRARLEGAQLPLTIPLCEDLDNFVLAGKLTTVIEPRPRIARRQHGGATENAD